MNAPFTLKNLQSGETWTFPTEEALNAFLVRRRTEALAGSGEPQEKITGSDYDDRNAPWPGEK